MLINLRDRNNKLIVKDMLDIDFDMMVEEENKQFYVAVNRKYRLDEVFYNEKDAEEKMIGIANTRNNLECELRNY